jgi:hypothetical protein
MEHSKITVMTREDAFKEVNLIFPTDYEKDYSSSERAGYDIYRHRELNYYNWISDLGNRLEVNLHSNSKNETINIWIEPEAYITKSCGTNMSQSEYEELISNGENKLSEERAKQVINDFFGFEISKIQIISEVETFVLYNNTIKPFKTYKRNPQYCATDYNYIRFNVNGWYYEMVNGNLRFYYK